MNYKVMLVGIMLLLITTIAFALDDSSLVAWYKLDENSGTTINDSKGTNNGVFSSITLNQTGLIGKDYNFTDNTSDVNLTDSAFDFLTQHTDGNFTVSAWVKAPYINPDGASQIWSKLDNPVQQYGTSAQIRQTTGQIWVAFYQDNTHYRYYATPNTTITDGAWHHVAVTESVGYTNVKVYLDGIEQTLTPSSVGTPATINISVPFQLGTRNSAYPLTLMRSSLDEVGVFNTALSATDINLLRNNGLGVTFCPGDANEFSTACVDENLIKLDFNVYGAGTSTHLTNIDYDCNVNAYDLTGQNSPFSSTADQNTYLSCDFKKTGYDTNTQLIYYDSNQTKVIYLTDTTAPTVGTTTLSGFTFYGSYIKGNGIILGGTATDSGTGIDTSTCEVQYTNGGAWFSATASWNTDHCESSTFTAANGTAYKGNTRVDDLAGNTGTGTASSTYTGDSSGPTNSATHDQFAGTTDANLTLTCIDALSGCQYISYSLDSAAWTNAGGNLDDTNLIAWYSFEETAGTTAVDMKGYDQNMSLTNTLINQEGIVARGEYFNSNSFDRNIAFGMNTGTLSITAWFKADTNANNRTLVHLFSGINSEIHLFIVGSTGKIAVNTWDGATPGQVVTLNGGWDDNAWHSVVATKTGTTVKIYVDGNMETTSGTAHNTTSNNNLYVGKDGINDLTYYTGYLDEVSIWNDVLTAEEAQRFYNNGVGLTYPFVDGNFQTSTTVSGTGSHRVYYYSLDNLDNNSGISYYDFNIYGYAHFTFWDENINMNITGVQATFNGSTTTTVGSTYDANLFGITSTEYTFEFLKAGGTYYPVRYYSTDLNQFSDINVLFALIPEAIDRNIDFQIYQTDETTIYANVFVELREVDTNHVVGRTKTDASGNVMFTLKDNDMNYWAIIDNGTDTYYPVLLSILFPKDEDTLLDIDGNYMVEITQNLYSTFDDLDANMSVYLLPDTLNPYHIKITDKDGNYYPRTYDRIYPGNPLTDTLQPYLVHTSAVGFTTLRTLDAYTYLPLSEVDVKIYKFLPAIGRTLVEEVLTDGTGTGYASFISGDAYELEVYKDSVLRLTKSVNGPTAAGTIFYIYLTDINTVPPVLQASFINIAFYPYNTKIYTTDNNFIQTVSLDDMNHGNAVSAIRVTITNNGTLLYNQNFVGVTLPFINGIPLDTTAGTVNGVAYDSNYDLNICVRVTAAYGSQFRCQAYNVHTSYDIVNSIGIGFRPLMGCSVDPDVPCPNLLLMALFIAVAISVVVSISMGYVNMMSIGFFFLFVMGIFAYITWVPYVIYAIMFAGVIGLIIAEHGRQRL